MPRYQIHSKVGLGEIEDGHRLGLISSWTQVTKTHRLLNVGYIRLPITTLMLLNCVVVVCVLFFFFGGGGGGWGGGGKSESK